MTEPEWVGSTDPQKMLMWLQLQGSASERKLRLFAVACYRRIWHLLTDERCRQAVEVAERYADARAYPTELELAQIGVEHVPAEVNSRWGAAWGTTLEEPLEAAWESLREAAGWGETAQAEQTEEAPFLRDIFGPLPFRSVQIEPSWRTSAVATLANAIYEDHLFADMPVLADALEDAGCTDKAILTHSRQPGEHVRGCWVLDLILGKE